MGLNNSVGSIVMEGRKFLGRTLEDSSSPIKYPGDIHELSGFRRQRNDSPINQGYFHGSATTLQEPVIPQILVEDTKRYSSLRERIYSSLGVRPQI